MCDVDSQTTLKLPQRTYFAKLGNAIRKKLSILFLNNLYTIQAYFPDKSSYQVSLNKKAPVTPSRPLSPLGQPESLEALAQKTNYFKQPIGGRIKV